uniref:DUF5009 domain-containing protein n=1 Tax=Plectus sambesii TaxID=2011161 RepID=A0A914WJY0_9BILA
MLSSCTLPSSPDPEFAIDSALLNINLPPASGNYSLWAQSSECYKCQLMSICDFANGATKLLVNTTFETSIEIRNSNGTFCFASPIHFGEKGQYNLSAAGGSCLISEIKAPVNSFLPIYWACLFFLLLAVVYRIGLFGFNRYRKSAKNTIHIEKQSQADGSDAAPKKKRKRLRSLDTFRGMCMWIVVFVNYGGGSYWFFDHSDWNGLTLADLVFPWFMFIMGTSMALSFDSLARNKVPVKPMLVKIFRRSIILFLLGVFIKNNGLNKKWWGTVRVMGVLQRFAIAYLFLAVMSLLTLKTADKIRQRRDNATFIKAALADILAYWINYVVIAVLTLVWCLIFFLVPAPGCPAGYLGPGGLSEGGNYWNCTGGITGYIDLKVFGRAHIYGFPTSEVLYNTSMPFDPEGLLGCLTSILTVFLGFQAGQILLIYQKPKDRLIRLLFWAVLYGLISGALCGFSQNEGVLPVNKNLWTPSFATVLASLGYFIIIIFYIIIDELELWQGEPFYFVGMNSLIIYLGHGIFGQYLPVQWTVGDDHASKLYMHIWGACFWTIVAYLMHLQKYYFSI